MLIPGSSRKRSSLLAPLLARSSLDAHSYFRPESLTWRHGGYLGIRLAAQALQFCLATTGRDQTGRTEDHHQQDDQADPELAIFPRDLVLEELGQPGQHRGTGHRARQ